MDKKREEQRQKESQFQELKKIIMIAIGEAIAGEISDADNAESTAETIQRHGYKKEVK